MKNLDESLITRWFDDELSPEEEAEFAVHLEAHPELLEQKAEIRQLGDLLRQEVPSELEVPHPEFFASRISHEIALEASVREESASSKSAGSNSSWWLPISAAAAALVVGFFGGSQFGSSPSEQVANTDTKPANIEHTVLFTPDTEIRAELVDNENATLILLNGMESLPETFELVGFGASDQVITSLDENSL